MYEKCGSYMTMARTFGRNFFNRQGHENALSIVDLLYKLQFMTAVFSYVTLHKKARKRMHTYIYMVGTFNQMEAQQV